MEIDSLIQVCISVCLLLLACYHVLMAHFHSTPSPPKEEEARNEVARALASYVENDAYRTKLVDELKKRGITSPQQLDNAVLKDLINAMEEHKARHKIVRELASYVENDAYRTKVGDELKKRGITSTQQLDYVVLKSLVNAMEEHKTEEETNMIISKLFHGER